MSAVRISFILASFNGATYIEEQLDSILASLGANDEVIVSDDGSTDRTVERVRRIGDPRIRLITGGERLGYQDNFARAFAASKGAFIFFSDQDDICLPARVPLSLAQLAHSECVCGDATVVDETLSPLHESHFRNRKARFSAASIFFRPSVIGATMACRRTFVEAFLPFPQGVPHDMWLSIQAARRGSLAVVGEPFILYRRHATVVSATASASNRAIWLRIRERLLLFAAILGWGRK